MSATTLSIVLALGAATSFGIGMALEHRGANRAPARQHAHPGLLFDLLRSNHWRWGLIITGAGYVMQAVAFGTGRLVLIEPIMTLALVVALAFGGIIDHRPLTHRQWATVLATTAAVLVFTATTAPAAGRESAPITTWAPWLAGVGVAGGIVVLVSGHWPARWRAGGLALAGGCMYGVTDALTKTVTDGLGHHGVHVFASWTPYALLLAGTAAFFAQQTSYHASRLADAQPALSVSEPVVGTVIGITVLREHVHLTPFVDIVDGMAVVIMLIGIVTLGRLADRVCPEDPDETLEPAPGTAAAGTAVAQAVAAEHDRRAPPPPPGHRHPPGPGRRRRPG